MKLSKTCSGFTLTMSEHELDVLLKVYSLGKPSFSDALQSGTFKDESKGFKTAANKVGGFERKEYLFPQVCSEINYSTKDK